MNEEIYKTISRPFRTAKHGVKVLNLANKLISLFVYITYPVFLLLLIINKDKRFWKVFFIPALCFIIVSLFRKYSDFPRPYESLDILPLIYKDTKGKSFPSRHVSSIFIIAISIYYISQPMGMALMIMGLILAAIRVIGGVHFPKDVIVGAIFSIVFGILAWKSFLF